MAQEVRGVIARSKGQPVTIETVRVPDPGPGEVTVRPQACGVCHTDLHYREGNIEDAFPFLLGHEAAGIVAAVGEGVSALAPGDYVILAWRAPCGRCRSCRRGRPWYCFDSLTASQAMTLEDGTELRPALGIGAFSELTLVHASQAVKVDSRIPPDVAGLIGCGIMADAAIAGAALAGARLIVAVDVDPRKLEWARGFGATHTVNSREADPVKAIRALTEGHGADLVIDAVARPETYLQATRARDHAGTVVLVGVPAPRVFVEIPLLEVFGRGGALKASWYGDALPTRDFPILVELYLGGRLPLDGFVSERIGLDDVEEAFARMERGEVLRSVVML